MLGVTILGATGSVGKSTLDVIRRNSDRYEVVALTANRNVEALKDQCLNFQPKFAVMRDEKSALLLSKALKSKGSKTEVLKGDEGLCVVASAQETDVVMAAIVGAAGLNSSLAAAESGKRLLLANKESLVMSGALFMRAVRENGATLLPIDSEHNAIFQSLANGSAEHATGIRKIILTASGGPLLRTETAKLSSVTPDEACAHPNWDMGRKISVDSATMMNKGLELIEAKWLFAEPIAKIEIVVHPQSIIHSMVEYLDGSIISQMGNPDMRVPITHGLSWPERIESGVASLDLIKMKPLEFEVLDRNKFPCVALAEKAAVGDDSEAIVLNAANEIAVESFLHELIRFTDIPIIVEKVLNQISGIEASSIVDIIAIDSEARARAQEWVNK